jgi:hypothetical protein
LFFLASVGAEDSDAGSVSFSLSAWPASLPPRLEVAEGVVAGGVHAAPLAERLGRPQLLHGVGVRLLVDEVRPVDLLRHGRVGLGRRPVEALPVVQPRVDALLGAVRELVALRDHDRSPFQVVVYAVTENVNDGVVPLIVQTTLKLGAFTENVLTLRPVAVTAVKVSAVSAGAKAMPSIDHSTFTVIDGVVPDAAVTSRSRDRTSPDMARRTPCPDPDAVCVVDGTALTTS